MSFAESIRTCLTKYVDFKGRASRSEYWWFVLFIFLAYFGVAVVAEIAKAPALILVVPLALLLPQLAAGVRRLHDTGKSGWWYLICLVPYVGGIVVLVLLAQGSQASTNQYGPALGVPTRPDKDALLDPAESPPAPPSRLTYQ
jgi:uncharacterized membrane protein YhaH (DUF805 family)